MITAQAGTTHTQVLRCHLETMSLIWHGCFQSYEELLLIILRSVVRTGALCLRVAARRSLPCVFIPSGCSLQPLGAAPRGQGAAGPGSRLEQAAPQVLMEAAQSAATARSGAHGQPGVHVGLCCLPARTALLQGGLQLAAPLPAQGRGFPPWPGCCTTEGRAEAPVEITAGGIRSEGFAVLEFCFALCGSHLLASAPRVSPPDRELGCDRVLKGFVTACIIMPKGKPNACFMGLGAPLNLLKEVWRELH